MSPVFPEPTSHVKVPCFCQNKLSVHPKGNTVWASHQKNLILFIRNIYTANWQKPQFSTDRLHFIDLWFKNELLDETRQLCISLESTCWVLTRKRKMRKSSYSLIPLLLSFFIKPSISFCLMGLSFILSCCKSCMFTLDIKPFSFWRWDHWLSFKVPSLMTFLIKQAGLLSSHCFLLFESDLHHGCSVSHKSLPVKNLHKLCNTSFKHSGDHLCSVGQITFYFLSIS